MEYANSPLELWNLCQHSLLRHGELHNNLRMTWGKAVPLWTESLDHSLYIGQMLNDKYALDGRDPSSVVGIQWCHGLFDRPFFPSMPVMGVVRKRDVITHQTRLDMHAYDAHIQRNQSHFDGIYIVMGIGVIATCVARMLFDHGLDVRMVDSGTIQGHEDDALDASDVSLFPSWMEQRIASICESSGINTIADVCAALKTGIEVIDTVPTTQHIIVYSDASDGQQSGPLSERIEHEVWSAAKQVWLANAIQSVPTDSIQKRLF